MTKVSILMLTHNAPSYVKLSIDSLRSRTKGVDYELIVLDNRSKFTTRTLLLIYKWLGKIDKLRLLEYNSLFAKGNNIAATMASGESDLYLLLNSDVEIQSSDWLKTLVDMHESGVTAYGMVDDPLRVDGYCYLVDADLYSRYLLDEDHQWWWAITKQQARILSDGYKVKGYEEHEKWLHHFGGKSGTDYKGARGMDVTREQVHGWFNGKSPLVIDRPGASDD